MAKPGKSSSSNSIFKTTGQMQADIVEQVSDLLNDGLFYMDQELILSFVNNRMAKMLGFTNEDLIGQKISRFIDPIQNKDLMKQFDLLPEPGKPPAQKSRYEIIWRNKENKRVYTLVSPKGIFSAQSRFTGCYAVVTDVTRLKQMEHELRESESRYYSFLKNFDGIVYKGALDFKPLFFHGSVETITGYSEIDFINGKSSWDKIILDEDKQRLQESFFKIRNNPQFSTTRIYRISHKNGKIRWVKEFIRNICDQSGRPQQVEGVIYDITEQKEMELEKEKIQSQLIRAQKMEAIGTLAGGVAHDFNNILNAINGYSELALMQVDERDKTIEYLNQIRLAGLRAAKLTSQLLLFSRRHPVNQVPFSINTTIINLHKMLTRIIGENIEIKTDLADNLWYTYGNEGNIEQVLMNLLINARDAMPQGGQVLIKTFMSHYEILKDRDVSGSYVGLIIADTGTGINNDDLDKIFEPFYTTKSPEKGTGLGLSVVYGIVQQHKGWIDVESRAGRGTRFIIKLPAVKAFETETANRQVNLNDLRGDGETILYLEDDKLVSTSTTLILKSNKYNVLNAYNGREAETLFDKHRNAIKLLISDVVLPDTNGLEMADRCRGRLPDLPVILCSGYSDYKSQWEIIKQKNYIYIQKPFRNIDLLRFIKTALKR